VPSARHGLPAPSTLAGGAFAGVIDQDLPHRSRRNPKEVRPVLPLNPGIVDETKVGLVHEGRGLKDVVSPLATHQARCEAPQLLVDDLKQPASLPNIPSAVSPLRLRHRYPTTNAVFFFSYCPFT
jgi:hypothetical protein